MDHFLDEQSEVDDQCCYAAQALCRHRDRTVDESWPGLSLTLIKLGELPLNVTKIPHHVMDPVDIELTQQAPETLVTDISQGKWTSVQVAQAFLRRAALSQELTNCVTEMLPSAALDRARQLDEYYLTHSCPVGPLHGLPISVPEDTVIRNPRSRDRNGSACSNKMSEVIDTLWKAGVVLYARTAQSQTLLETSSHLTGVTVNPFNRLLTCGGGSGGQGALLGLRGGCLAVGKGDGVSFSSASASQGLYALRPSSCASRLRTRQSTGGKDKSIADSVGPMSTSLGGIKLFMRTVLERQSGLGRSDGKPHLHKIHARPELHVGVMWHDGIVQPHPPVQRALRSVCDRLARIDSIKLSPWQPYKHDEASRIVSRMLATNTSDSVRKSARESPRYGPNGTIARHDLERRCEAFRVAYAANWASSVENVNHGARAVDAVLCPASPGAAPPHGYARYWGYTAVWDLLEYPSMVFPVTAVDPDIDKIEQDFQPLSPQDLWNHRLYEPQMYRDAPVALQLVVRQHEDEKLIELLELLQHSPN